MKQRVLIYVVIGLVLFSCRDPGAQDRNDDQPDQFNWMIFSRGVDLSYVNEIEDYGSSYFDSGELRDPFRIFHDYGANTVRVRLWHNPQWLTVLTGGKLYSDLADAAQTIARAKSLGMAVNLDIHYSDTWADPGHQEIPEAWKNLSFQQLCDSVYQYTLTVLNHLKEKGCTPEMVQIGNETNSGMLFPQGKVENDYWKPFGDLLNAGIRAVRDFSKSADIHPAIILHVAQYQNAQWWIEKVVQKGLVTDFDILGISHYPKWSTVNDMTRITSITRQIITTYRKKVMIVETAYPWTAENADQYPNIIGASDSVPSFPLTPDGQLNYMKTLTQAVIDGGGSGIMYWEPAWITSSMRDQWGTGSAWDNCTLFDFNGNTLKSMKYLNFLYNF